jgi:hypothetical protein
MPYQLMSDAEDLFQKEEFDVEIRIDFRRQYHSGK